MCIYICGEQCICFSLGEVGEMLLSVFTLFKPEVLEFRSRNRSEIVNFFPDASCILHLISKYKFIMYRKKSRKS